MQMVQPTEAPLPRGPPVAKTDHPHSPLPPPPPQSPGNGRCHSSLGVTVSQPAARRCWVTMCRTQHRPSPFPPVFTSGKGVAARRGGGNNWIGELRELLSCSSLGTGRREAADQTVFVMGLSSICLTCSPALTWCDWALRVFLGLGRSASSL